MPVVTVTGTTGNDILSVAAASPDSGAYILDGAALVSFNSATSFTFNPSSGSDTFIIGNPTSGLFGPSGGIFFNGQTGDALEVVGGAALSEVYAPTFGNSGTLTYQTLEVQHLTISGSSGTFTLTFNGQTTAPLAFNATGGQVQIALSALSSIGGA